MKRLYLLPFFYPYSTFRECFLEDEIKYLAKEFDEIYLVPYFHDEPVREYPKNCKLIPSNIAFPETRRFSFNRKPIPYFFKELFRSEVLSSPKKIKRLLSQCFHLNYMLNSKKIKDIFSSLTSQDVLYFYWGNGYNSLAVLPNCKAKVVSRFHGWGDLWEEEYDGYIPFRRHILGNLDAVITISKKGYDFLKTKYPFAKTCLFPLGSNDYGLCLDNSKSNSIRILSCSMVYPLKRVDLIFRSLLQLEDMNIKWTHIGGGADLEKVRQMIDNTNHPNVEITLLGEMLHDKVMNYMKNNRFDLFINLSTIEGVPVSIMEAISFDIPVVATNVGGTSDVVSAECGVLLSPNPSEIEVANSIRIVLQGHYSPRLFWENHYSADKNYGDFAKFISEL